MDYHLPALIGNRGQWSVSQDGEYIQRKVNPEEDSVGDVRVKFYSTRQALMNQRVTVSILGIQKGETIDFESDDSLFLMKVGNE